MAFTRKLEMRVGWKESQNFIAVMSAVGICSMDSLPMEISLPLVMVINDPFYSTFTPGSSPWSIPWTSQLLVLLGVSRQEPVILCLFYTSLCISYERTGKMGEERTSFFSLDLNNQYHSCFKQSNAWDYKFWNWRTTAPAILRGRVSEHVNSLPSLNLD